MSSISRRRNGLMALSVIGAPVLREVQGPSISRQDARFCYFTGRHQLPPERFSPMLHTGHCPELDGASGGKRTAAHSRGGCYSMTSVARARIEGGPERPSSLAVLRLTTSSNVVGCWTGRSTGLAPLRILSTYRAPRRAIPLRLAP